MSPANRSSATLKTQRLEEMSAYHPGVAFRLAESSIHRGITFEGIACLYHPSF